MCQLFIVKNGVFYGNKIGYNYIPIRDNSSCSKHAEVCLIDKLPFRKRIKTIKIVSLRTTLSGELRCAKPCCECINFLRTKALEKGYNISKVYYSTNDGDFVCVKLKDLDEDINKHVSKGQKIRMKKCKE